MGKISTTNIPKKYVAVDCVPQILSLCNQKQEHYMQMLQEEIQDNSEKVVEQTEEQKRIEEQSQE